MDGPMPQDTAPVRPGVRNGVKLMSPNPVAVPPPVPGISSSKPGVNRDTEITGMTVRVTTCQSPKRTGTTGEMFNRCDVALPGPTPKKVLY